MSKDQQPDFLYIGCSDSRVPANEIMGLLSGWLHNVMDVYRLHYEELTAITDETQRYRRLVELNVAEQCVNVIKAAYVQKSILEHKLIGIYGWMYDLNDGQLIDLEADVKPIVTKNKDILTKQSFLY